MAKYFFSPQFSKLRVIAGPCMAESAELLDQSAQFLKSLSQRLGFELIFKASFDKANRTSIHSYRGPGLDQAMRWFADLKNKYQIPILTDVHESWHCAKAAEVVDVLQIPAFLCRQTDLIAAAVTTKRAINIKRGQFLAPEGLRHLSLKVRESAKLAGIEPDFAITERGYTFGYGNLVVDMRSFKHIHAQGGASVFDVTHSLQLPSTGGKEGEVSGGAREYAPILMRSALATGYVDTLFLEVHPNPHQALSDASTQLSFHQAETLLGQATQLWPQLRGSNKEDSAFS